MAQIIQLFIYGLQLGTVYALVALGYTMVYGIVRLINYAHGDYLMLGAYAAFLVGIQGGFVLALIAAMFAAGVIAVATDQTAYKPMREEPKLSTLVVAIGVSMFIQHLSRAIPFMGPFPRVFPAFIKSIPLNIGGVAFNSTQIILIVLAVALMLGLNFVVSKTKAGRSMRAVSMDRDAAVLMGVDINRTIAITFFIGGLVAGAGGVFYSIMYPTLEVSIGSFLGGKAFIAAVVGGIGNLKGAMFGGIVMGIAEIYATSLNADVGFGVTYLILIIILLIKPAGLFGKFVPEKV